MSIPLPDTVNLPTVAKLNAAQVSAAFDGASRQKLHHWRKHHGFPTAYRGQNTSFTATANIAAWLDRRGVKVKWV